MEHSLTKKLNTSVSYTDNELLWCLNNIGHPSPEIRDELIYTTFCHGFEQQLFHLEQFQLLSETIYAEKLLEHPDTLTRSFTALLASLLIFCDTWKEGPYFKQLSLQHRDYLFQMALDYINNENDTRGYDDTFGWIHALAHGSELLLAVSLHHAFPKKNLATIWETIHALFKRQQNVFSSGEPERFANVIVQLILAEKLEQRQLVQWLEQIDFPDVEPTDYFRSLNMKQWISYIYFHLEKEGQLEETLKTTLLNKY